MSAGARVTRLSVTPVKGLALHHPDEILLLRTGAAGDREFFVIDGRDRLISIWKTGRLVRFRAAHDTRSGRITLSSAGEQVCDGPARPGAPVVADFYRRRKVPGTVVQGPWNAVLTEAAGLGLPGIVNTPGLAEVYRAHGSPAIAFMPAVDAEVYHPPAQPRPEAPVVR